MNRIVEPEILDDLDPSDPAAVRSRRDLRFINGMMRGQAWIIDQISAMNGVRRIVEIGAGDGGLSNELKSLFPDCEVIAVDLIPRPETVRDDVLWESGSVFDYAGFNQDTVVVANLFIHHFEDKQLWVLGEKLESVRAMIFAEPHRKKSAVLMGRMIFPLVNHVTRHDMITSIRAGFQRGEIPDLLGAKFQWEESLGLFGGIRMMGVRR